MRQPHAAGQILYAGLMFRHPFVFYGPFDLNLAEMVGAIVNARTEKKMMDFPREQRFSVPHTQCDRFECAE